jgi:GTP pyrophosphokinase
MKDDIITAIGEGGKLIELPLESKILDFAFALDTDCGIYFKKAFANGDAVGLDYTVKDGDNIKIIKSKKPTITPRLINYTKTGRAKNQIIKFLSTSKK